MFLLCLTHAHGNYYYLLPGLLSLWQLWHFHRLPAYAAFALDALELPAQFPVFLGGDMVEILADYPGIAAQQIDAPPVGCINSHLLHEFESLAALPAELVLPADLALDILAAAVVLFPRHLAEAVGAPSGVPVYQILFHIIAVGVKIKSLDCRIEPGEVCYFLFHIIRMFY
ncbi:hypothetical protein [Lepagella muris]|uniref:hypothetical protein n=1 Tax=Lepagella muris TaxID=3032870 RepID=UPI00146B8DA8|nr:hypothetical protein [Lepagella muris]